MGDLLVHEGELTANLLICVHPEKRQIFSCLVIVLSCQCCRLDGKHQSSADIADSFYLSLHQGLSLTETKAVKTAKHDVGFCSNCNSQQS